MHYLVCMSVYVDACVCCQTYFKNQLKDLTGQDLSYRLVLLDLVLWSCKSLLLLLSLIILPCRDVFKDSILQVKAKGRLYQSQAKSCTY